jgi:hypothetical protein
MVSTHAAVHLGGGDVLAVFPMGGNKSIEDIEDHPLPNTKTALDELVWLAKATIAAKAASCLSGRRRKGSGLRPRRANAIKSDRNHGKDK